MPSRNVVKADIPNTFYHVYARGHGRMVIFREDQDYKVFFNLIKRYLNTKIENDPYGIPYTNLHGRIELTCYCLMPNHFHMLLYQINEHAMPRLMRGIMTSYS
jgi:REP element-mobilizing transposase RayT